MSLGVLKRRYPNVDGAGNSCSVKSPSSADEAIGCIWTTQNEVAGVLKRSHSTDGTGGGEYVNWSSSATWAPSFDAASAEWGSSSNVRKPKYSPFREETDRSSIMSWTLPTNICYGPQDIVTSLEDLNWPNPKEPNGSSENVAATPSNPEVCKQESSPPEPNTRILTWGPAKDFIRRYMKRSISMDEDYNAAILSWVFPDEDESPISRDEDCAAKIASSFEWNKLQRSVSLGLSQDFKRILVKREASSPEKAPSGEKKCDGARVVTWGVAKTVPVAVKAQRSVSLGLSRDFYRTGVRKEASRPMQLKKAQYGEKKCDDTRAVTGSLAKAVPIDDDERKKNEKKKLPEALPILISGSARRSNSTDEEYDPGNVEVSPSKRSKNATQAVAIDIAKAVKRSTPIDEDCSADKSKKRFKIYTNDEGAVLNDSSPVHSKITSLAPEKSSTSKEKEYSAVKVKRFPSIDIIGESVGESWAPRGNPSLKTDSMSKGKVLALKKSDERALLKECGPVQLKISSLAPKKSDERAILKNSCPVQLKISSLAPKNSDERADLQDSSPVQSKVSSLAPKKSGERAIIKDCGPIQSKITSLASKGKEYTAAKVKRSLSIDNIGKSGGESWKTDFRNEYYNTGLVKRSCSIDGTRSPKPAARTIRIDVSSPSKQCSSNTEDYKPGKVKRSRSTDDTAISARFARPSTPRVPNFTEEYYNTGLVKRSTSTDVTASSTRFARPSTPIAPNFREEYYNTGLVKRSHSIDSPKPSAWCTLKRSSSKDKVWNAGKVKRSLSTDGIGRVKRVTWAPIVDSYRPGQVKRSVSTDCANGSKSKTCVRKSILKPTMSHFKDEYYNTGMVKRSRSIEGTKSPKNFPNTQGVLRKTPTGEISSPNRRPPAKDERRKSPPPNHRFSEGDQRVSKKSVEWHSTEEGKRSGSWSLPNDAPSSRPKRKTRSAARDKVVNSKKEVSATRSARRNEVEKCKTEASKRLADSKDKDVSFKVETSLSKKSSPSSNEARKSVLVGDATKSKDKGVSSKADTSLSKKSSSPSNEARKSVSENKTLQSKIVKGTVRTTRRIETKSLIRNDATGSVTNTHPAPIQEAQTPIKFQSSKSWDEAITIEDRNRSNAKKERRSSSRDDATSSVELKRSASTDAIEKRSTSRDRETASSEASTNKSDLQRSTSKEDIITERSVVKSFSQCDAIDKNELKRTASTDATKEKSSSAVERHLSDENGFNSKDLKRTASTDAIKEKKSSARLVSEAQKPPEVTASSSTKTRQASRGSSVLTKWMYGDCEASPSKSNASESKENAEMPDKRPAPKEDAGCPSSIKRSHSKEDASISGDSKRDSGISVSEDLSDNEFESSYKTKREYKRNENRDGFSCAICSKSFRGVTDLRRHLLIHADEKPHVCEICDKAYRQINNLRNHMKVEHSKEREFVCQFCTKPFPLKQRLKIHLRTHIKDKLHTCPYCSKTFGRNGQLQKHLITHDESAKKVCDVCPSTFTTEKSLNEHKLCHAENDCVCQICNTTFKTEKSMRSHMNSAHGNLKHFECQICEKHIADDLQKHMKTHAIARPHECEICKAVFAQRTQYNIHMRTHTGERPFQCRICWQSFGHSNVLKLHIRKHTGEKPFKCILCTKGDVGFSQLSHLKTHMKSIHNEECAYICEGCKECFKLKFHLEDHVKNCAEVQSKMPTAEEQKAAEKDAELLAHLRYLIAVLLKKISTPEKLKLLGFEKRLIDNVLIAALKLANQKVYDCKSINELDQMKLNIEVFLEWIVPKNVMDEFKKECPSIESILEKIVSMYLKQVE